MNNSNLTLDYIRRQAKKIRKERNITHTQALELLAQEYGYSNWKHCLRALSKQSDNKVKPAEKPLQLNFTDWLGKHKNRNSPLGYFASDALGDKTWPSYNTLDGYYSYLVYMEASDSAITTLVRAWKSYMAYLRRKNLPIPNEPTTMEEVIIQNKQKYLDENYPFEEKLKLTDKMRCIHCGSIITVGDYKVFKIEWEEYICCPNAPECNGTIIDWVDPE
jgi:hypothetical protein